MGRRTVVLLLLLTALPCFSQTDSTAVTQYGSPVVFSNDTLFVIRTHLGPFSAQQRADAIVKHLHTVIKQGLNPDSIRVVRGEGYSTIVLDSLSLMAVTGDDAAAEGTSREQLATRFESILKNALKEMAEAYSFETLIKHAAYAAATLLLAFLLFWGMVKVFPKGYDRLERWEGRLFRSVRFRSTEIIGASTITTYFIVLLKGIRLALSLLILYYAISFILSLFPYTRAWDVKPILRGVFIAILVTAAAVALFRMANSLFDLFLRRIDTWKGTLIKSVRVKSVEVLSEDRIAATVGLTIKIGRFVVFALIVYFYVTIVFSLFHFTKTWASTLFNYILMPLARVVQAFVDFLPSLFFILVIVVVTRYVIKLIRFFFFEIGKGTISLPGFYQEWAEPTYKIVRFLVIAFAGVMIFPYLPGSDSDAFKGISVFLGILFSLGSAGAVSNMVAGVVLTYMRPFRIGDRVKIADTLGDVIEKTLLVTRVRTIKNVDVTIPNAMVLSSHIINFSSSAIKRGLILHTTVTIGYDVPWKKVHELLLAAAAATNGLLKEPEPFVFHTNLDDSYVHYEINAYTHSPNEMASIYSALNRHIQDTFNEAGVEIMSPHYTAVRDGNTTAIPDEYLPKSYAAPGFRVFPFGWSKEKESGGGE